MTASSVTIRSTRRVEVIGRLQRLTTLGPLGDGRHHGPFKSTILYLHGDSALTFVKG